MVVVLHSGINHQQFSGLQHLVMGMAVEDFSVLGEDGGERHAPALCQRYAFHVAHYLLLHYAKLHAAPCHSVHLLAKVARVVNLRYLQVILNQPH